MALVWLAKWAKRVSCTDLEAGFGDGEASGQRWTDWTSQRAIFGIQVAPGLKEGSSDAVAAKDGVAVVTCRWSELAGGDAAVAAVGNESGIVYNSLKGCSLLTCNGFLCGDGHQRTMMASHRSVCCLCSCLCKSYCCCIRGCISHLAGKVSADSCSSHRCTRNCHLLAERTSIGD